MSPDSPDALRDRSTFHTLTRFPAVRRLAMLGLLVVLAGCGSAPPATEPPTDGTLAVSLSNEHDRPYRVDLSVVPPDVEGLRVTYENGTTRQFQVGSMDDLPARALDDATGVEPLGVDAPARQYRLDPGSGTGETSDGVPREAAVVYFILEPDGELRAAGLVTCGEGIYRTELSIGVDADGEIHSRVHCAG